MRLDAWLALLWNVLAAVALVIATATHDEQWIWRGFAALGISLLYRLVVAAERSAR